ncbi:MAG: YlxM family DNA-binding protein [bacterium]|nr:YlxM family DNA-binding protein [bacterium]
MDKIVEQGLLYDFYGELLTEHQRKIYEEAISEDLSLSELAEEYGISRQGIHDLIKRCDKIMLGYEEKLHLMDKFKKTRETVAVIYSIAEHAGQEEIKMLSQKILDEL